MNYASSLAGTRHLQYVSLPIGQGVIAVARKGI